MKHFRATELTEITIDMPIEVPGYPGYYADEKGYIYSYKKKNWRSSEYRFKKLRGQLHRDGYIKYVISLNGKPKNVMGHTLIALAYLGERELGMEVNHINGHKADNRATNLEYCTKSENQKHAFRLGLSKNNMTSEISSLGRRVNKEVNGKKVEQLLGGKVIAEFPTISDAAKSVGINRGNLSYRLKLGKPFTCGGFKWRYKL